MGVALDSRGGAQSAPTEVRSDLALSRRLERAEGVANARFVEARARVMPHMGAQWIEVAGTYAMYDGPQSPCTQTFGLGLFQMPTAEDMDRLEGFFQRRGASVFHEVSPLAGIEVLGVLHHRGYRPVEVTSVLFLPLAGWAADTPPDNPAIAVRQTGAEEEEHWARTMAAGWSDSFDGTALAELLLTSAHRTGGLSFLAEWEGRAIAAGSLALHDGVGLLAGASTIPEFRHRGAQRALLEARLASAAGAGCDLAMICAAPGSSSQRNAERQGFRIAYTRTKWCLGA